jgi:hypothetical protein
VGSHHVGSLVGTALLTYTVKLSGLTEDAQAVGKKDVLLAHAHAGSAPLSR